MTAVVPKQWDRWIYTSAAYHFDTKRDGIHLHIEGFPRQTDTLSEWFEFRLDGPFYDRTTDGEWIVDVEINIAVVCVLNNNAYRIHEIAGIVAAAFTNTIPVNRRGDPASDPANDGSLLGCLRLMPGKREKVEKSFFGKVRPDTDLMQASLEGHYRMFLSS